MYQNFEADVMDDLFYDAADAPVQDRRSAPAYDAYSDSFDGYDESFDALDEDIDAAVSGSGQQRRGSRRSTATRAGRECQERYDGCVSLGPRRITVCDECRRECTRVGRWPYDKCPRPGSNTTPSRFDAYDEYEHFDGFEDAMVDALEAEDTDEFFRRLARGIGRVARGIGRGIGQVARVVAPIASAIPLPWTQAIGRVASVAGRLMADGADEFEAIDALIDLADAEDLWDAAAPAIATMAVHGVMPQAARLPANTRQQLVRATTQAAQTIARQQGTQAVRALPAVVQTAQRMARQQGVPPTALPRIIQQVGQRVSRNPQMMRRLAQPAGAGMRRRCASCGRAAHARPTAARRGGM